MNKTTFAAIALTLGALWSGHALAADTAPDAKATDKAAVTAQAAGSNATRAADPYAELDKIKKW
ncbi:MAG: hypothetical protein QE265_07635 [Rhodoferax sp.]|nr:hypothetical protein [Rhodoferax sp.]